ncbi:MAG: ABC-2 type transport system permease protein [Candidatus Magnetoglobus multicellularis str. Araruama]|uniref:ABC-2 type transport system permease protein n=1 Tax=Candidatus Magnetoglobus multicellularis str. Araruama TaxID=890399 RepID=A0A1V1PHP9_9BACT|nr:MAG: ABC-2 type transport system permease protein [Candidatus Magnetoglobus multicellularis str. Araruama]
MKEIQTLLRPRFLALVRQRLSLKKLMAMSFFAGIGISIWSIIFYVSYRVLTYFKSVESIGDFLSYKLLSMILLTLFSLLVFSAILTALSKLFLSTDLGLVHALPVKSESIFVARWIESTFDSSWMMLLYTAPAFIAFGIVFDGSIFYYFFLLCSLLCMAIIAGGLSALIVMPIVLIMPATRIRSIFAFLGLGVFVTLYVSFRIMQPERFVNPEGFASIMLYIRTISLPSTPMIPSTWVFNTLQTALEGHYHESLFHIGILISFSLTLIFFNIIIAQLIYFRGYSKTQTAQSRLISGNNPLMYRLLSKVPGPVRAIFIKESKTFWRDQTQWSQLFLIGALIVIYLYNFSVLPFDQTPFKAYYIENLFSFLNIALAAFVLTAIGARFVFPSISHEGMSFWIIQSSPVSIRTYLWIKWLCYFIPLIIFSELLIITTNILLHVNPFMKVLSVITIACITPGVVATGIGLGAAYPDFKSENPTQTVTGFGGLMYMFCSSAFFGSVVLLETGPVYVFFNAHFQINLIKGMDIVLIILSFSLSLLICVCMVFIPMRFGEHRLTQRIQKQTPDIGYQQIESPSFKAEAQTRQEILLTRVNTIRSGNANRYPAKNVLEEIRECC